MHLMLNKISIVVGLKGLTNPVHIYISEVVGLIKVSY
jgi:hypothetical protein